MRSYRVACMVCHTLNQTYLLKTSVLGIILSITKSDISTLIGYNKMRNCLNFRTKTCAHMWTQTEYMFGNEYLPLKFGWWANVVISNVSELLFKPITVIIGKYVQHTLTKDAYNIRPIQFIFSIQRKITSTHRMKRKKIHQLLTICVTKWNFRFNHEKKQRKEEKKMVLPAF